MNATFRESCHHLKGHKGIGRAAAGSLPPRDAVAVCGRDDNALKLTIEELRANTKTDVVGVKANIMSSTCPYFVSDRTEVRPLDVLVNNAGDAHIGGIATITDEVGVHPAEARLHPHGGHPYMRAAGRIDHQRHRHGGREPSAHFMLPGVTDSALLASPKRSRGSLRRTASALRRSTPEPSTLP
jgi:hypothetical protein